MSNRQQAFGVALIALGGIFLFTQIFDFNWGANFWPFFIIIPGMMAFYNATFADKPKPELMVPGSTVTTIGLMLMFMNMTGLWETWAYAWALIPASVGFGEMLQASVTDNARLQEKGRQKLFAGLFMFAGFGLFFELFIFQNWASTFIGRYLLPIGLIAGGVYLLKNHKEGFELGDAVKKTFDVKMNVNLDKEEAKSNIEH